jgi:hypothetical protein
VKTKGAKMKSVIKGLFGKMVVVILVYWAIEIWHNQGNAIPIGIVFLLAYIAQWVMYLEQK